MAWTGPSAASYQRKSSLGRINKHEYPGIELLSVTNAGSVAIAAVRKRILQGPGKRVINRTKWLLFYLVDSRGSNPAALALANKRAQYIWVVLRGEECTPPEERMPLATEKAVVMIRILLV